MCQEAPPLSTVLENTALNVVQKLDIRDLPPLPRSWFVSNDGRWLIQVQREAFIHNWRKQGESDRYPGFEEVIKKFRERLADFQTFLKDNGWAITPRQYELTYVNHISYEGQSVGSADYGVILHDFGWRDDSKQFLQHPEAIQASLAWPLPDGQGRLRARIQSATRPDPQVPVLLLDMTARGMPAGRTGDAWFDIAHEYIVRGFTDLTTERMQKDFWGRTS